MRLIMIEIIKKDNLVFEFTSPIIYSNVDDAKRDYQLAKENGRKQNDYGFNIFNISFHFEELDEEPHFLTLDDWFKDVEFMKGDPFYLNAKTEN